MNRGKFFSKTFLNSKSVFKSFNTKINTFQSISNCMNNQYHRVMINIITRSSLASQISKQITDSSSNSLVKSDSNSDISDLVSQESAIQLFSSFNNTLSFLNWRLLLSGKF